MLTISKPLTAAQATSYHAEEFSNSAENYYSSSAEIKGQWFGVLAGRLGLHGDVDDAQFKRLAEGQHPFTGQQLVKHLASRAYINANGATVDPMTHRAGWDATFSAPKSVSLAELVGGDDRIRLAHRAAVQTALSELEHYAQARIGGSHDPQTTRSLVVAMFEHDSARPVAGYPAAQRHTHCVFFNVTEATVDGQRLFRSVQPRELFRSQHLVTAVYRNELAIRLRELGYEVVRGASNQPEIAGFTQDYLDAASPRRQEILAHLKAEQRVGAAAAQIAAYQTREAKIQHAHERMQQLNQDLDVAFGSQAVKAVAAARARSQEIHHDVPELAATAITFAKQRNMERKAVIDERAVLGDALVRAMGTVPLAGLKAEFERRIETGEFLPRRQLSASSARAFTTPEMVALEQATIDRMLAGRGQHRAISAGWSADTSTDTGRAIATVLASRDTVTALDGVSGGGKTTALKTVHEAAQKAAQKASYDVVGLAPTSRAAQLLLAEGIESKTLQRHLAEPPALHQKRLYVLDESSLASTVQMHAFLGRLGPDDRVLLVGDKRQHQSVDAGRIYEQLLDNGLQAATLHDIKRQQDPEYRVAVEELSRGRVASALRLFNVQGRIHEIANHDARLKAVATTFVNDPAGTIIVAPDNHTRTELNDAIHAALTTDGAVRQKHVQTNVLVPRQEMTGADRGWADRYQVGDVLRYSRGGEGFTSGAYARVESKDAFQNRLTVTDEQTGARITYDPKRLKGVSVYRPAERSFAIGDRIQFTSPYPDKRVANRQLGTVVAQTGGTMRVKLESGRSVAFRLQDYRHLDYGYAVTSYSSQGQTANRVILHIDTDRSAEALVNQRLAYVALSRGRYDAQVFTNDGKAMARVLSRDISHRSAIEQSV